MFWNRKQSVSWLKRVAKWMLEAEFMGAKVKASGEVTTINPEQSHPAEKQLPTRATPD